MQLQDRTDHRWPADASDRPSGTLPSTEPRELHVREVELPELAEALPTIPWGGFFG